jgi:hypothetical protein
MFAKEETRISPGLAAPEFRNRSGEVLMIDMAIGGRIAASKGLELTHPPAQNPPY